MDSPYAVPASVPAQTERSETIMRDSNSSDAVVIQSEHHTTFVNPDTLDQTILHQKVFLWSVMGAPILGGAVTYRCKACKRYPFIETETVQCYCSKRVCKARCSRNNQCRPHSWLTSIKEFFPWFFQL
jgi:hypothetical protein